ncbi:MAG: LTA synthase family protein [Lachnospiraceae bacterium]|nr:LTA synthase family protein [Lachnospiraceae bacterium]
MNTSERMGEERKKDRMGIWSWILLFINSCYGFFSLEYVSNPDLMEMEWGYRLLNIAGILIISVFLLLWLNSLRKTLILVLAVYSGAGLLFAHVYASRGEPLQFIDIFSLGTALEVAGEYPFELTTEAAVMLNMSLVLLLCYLRLPKKQVVKNRKGKVLLRVGAFAGMLLGYYLYLNTSWNGDLGIVTDLWAPIKTYREYGTQVGFFSVAKYMRLTEPEGYSVDETEAIELRVKGELENGGQDSTSSEEKQKPVNVIAIMNESWADCRLLGELQTTKPVMPFYDSMKENTIKGTTLVCIRGGGTAKTEYEFLTGNSEKRFPGMVPYVSYFTHEQHSLFEIMEAQGYRTAAMHPNKGTNWNRNTAYRLMGADRFYTIEDFPENAGRVRAHISDEANYDAIIQLVEEKESSKEPFFLFDITMQNHGGYKAKKYVSTLQVEGFEDSTVNQYLSLLRESDQALEKLIRYFEQCPEPTLILMFGDHYPDLPEAFTEYLTGKSYEDSTLEEQQLYYSTPFFIWSNYGLEEAEGVVTSTNYLGSMMLKEAGLQMPEYNRYLLWLQQQIPALNHLGYQDTEGIWHSWEDAGEKEAQLELEYEYLQYNNLAENKNRTDSFFVLESSDS